MCIRLVLTNLNEVLLPDRLHSLPMSIVLEGQLAQRGGRHRIGCLVAGLVVAAADSAVMPARAPKDAIQCTLNFALATNFKAQHGSSRLAYQQHPVSVLLHTMADNCHAQMFLLARLTAFLKLQTGKT